MDRHVGPCRTCRRRFRMAGTAPPTLTSPVRTRPGEGHTPASPFRTRGPKTLEPGRGGGGGRGEERVRGNGREP